MSERHFGETYGRDPSRNYERFFVPVIGGPMAADLVREAALRAGERVLDVACGTGVVARLAAKAVGNTGTVAGLDVNPGMLAVARESTDAPITWHEASAESMPLPDASFDVVTCQVSLQFMPDKEAALREMRRVLVPGGRLVLNVPGPANPVFDVLARGLERHLGPEPAGFVHAVFSLHDTDEVQRLMTGAGFADVTVKAETKTLTLPAPKDFLWQYIGSTPLSAVVAQTDKEVRGALEREVVAGWKEFTTDGAMVQGQRVVIAGGRK